MTGNARKIQDSFQISVRICGKSLAFSLIYFYNEPKYLKGGIPMNSNITPENRPVTHRRRKRSKLKTFKEAYLPAVLAVGVVILIVVFICGSIGNANKKKQDALEASIAAENAKQEAYAALVKESEALMAEAAPFADRYDYDGAMAVLDRFTGNRQEFDALNDLYESYKNAKGQMVAWTDPAAVPNLSFQLLIADPDRAFTDATYKNSFDRNFITTEEFSNILSSLYENGYILVSLDDIVEATGTGYAPKTLYLPAGKKPLLLTQTNVNYSLYLVDSDGDMVADQNGSGFASRLVVDKGGNVTCEMVDTYGNLVTGAFDLVPILDGFIKLHPDFSYRGAKATLALTGYNGLFGYRTHSAAKNKLGETAYNQEIAGAKAVAQALKNGGYTLACYTYENINYGNATLARIEKDMNNWRAEVEPILGQLDTLVFAQNNDIAPNTDSYTGEKAWFLQQQGFRRYLGFCTTGTTWATLKEDYMRMGRLLVGGDNIRNHANWFEGIFDCENLLDR